MSIYVGKQYSARHKIPFDNIPSVKQVYKEKFTVNPAWCIEDYGSMLDAIFECTDMQSVSNGETINTALWSVLEYFKERENWLILVKDQKTIAKMLAS